MHEHLRDIGSMRLIFELRPDHLSGAYDGTRLLLGHQHHALATCRAEALRQNASALPRVSGSMKPTDAPPSTQSRSTSLSPSISRSLAVSRCRTLDQLGQFICGSSSADPIACPRFPAPRAARVYLSISVSTPPALMAWKIISCA